MSQLEISRIIPQSPEKVWSIISDFGGIHRFHSGVESSPIQNGKPSGLGSERECLLYSGQRITEVVSGYREGEWMQVSITKGSLPLNDVIVEFQITKTSEGQSKVDVRMDYHPKYGPMGKLMNTLLIRKKMSSIMEDLLAGLSLHAETGVLIGKGGVDEAKRSLQVAA
jgi:ribosome-associated toxin RatA of RatAB toxin-antitoxin module